MMATSTAGLPVTLPGPLCSRSTDAPVRLPLGHPAMCWERLQTHASPARRERPMTRICPSHPAVEQVGKPCSTSLWPVLGADVNSVGPSHIRPPARVRDAWETCGSSPDGVRRPAPNGEIAPEVSNLPAVQVTVRHPDFPTVPRGGDSSCISRLSRRRCRRASLSPLAAARLKSCAARFRFLFTPSPSQYATPRLHAAKGSPFREARLYQ